jgi:hypothetical protein
MSSDDHSFSQFNILEWKDKQDHELSKAIKHATPDFWLNKIIEFFGYENPYKLYFHIYGDASLDDNIHDASSSSWYIFGVYAANLGKKWGEWQERHLFNYGGHLHSCDLHPDRHGELTNILHSGYFSNAYITVIHRSLYAAWYAQDLLKNGLNLFSLTGDDLSATLWSNIAIPFAKSLDDHLNDILFKKRNYQLQRKFIRGITLNNRSHNSSEAFIKIISNRFTEYPINFVPGGHPGIDLVDVMCYSIKQLIQNSNLKCIGASFPRNFRVMFPTSNSLGHTSNSPTDCLNFRDMILRNIDPKLSAVEMEI